MTDVKLDNWYPIDPLSPRSDKFLQNGYRDLEIFYTYKQRKETEVIEKSLVKGCYISVTAEPEHLIPSHESPHGSPPLDFHPLSCDGEFKLLNITLRAETA